MDGVDALMEEFLRQIIDVGGGVREIWLIGSRANCSAQPDSDWDFIVFSDASTAERIKVESSLHRDDVDLFLVVDESGVFHKPWGENKGGSLKSWEWELLSSNRAQYTGTKWTPDQEAIEEGISTLGKLDEKYQRATRIWTCERGA